MKAPRPEREREIERERDFIIKMPMHRPRLCGQCGGLYPKLYTRIIHTRL